MDLENQSFEDRKKRIFDFMDEVKAKRDEEDRKKAYENLPETKIRKLEMTKKDGVDRCLNTVVGTLYRNSLPMNDLLPQTTCVNGTIQHLQNPMELQDQMTSFIDGRSGGQGPSYYVHEAIKRNNSPVLKKLVEECTRIVNEQFEDKINNPETINEEDYAFKLSGESESKLNDLMDSLQLNDLSDVIKDNVKTTAITEIEAAKKEKEERDNLEKELSGNDNLSTESAIDRYLAENNLTSNDEFYQPSLFEGILIGKFNSLPYTENVAEGNIDEVEYMCERVFGKIRDAFKEKKELYEDFKTYEGSYGRMLGMYRTEVKAEDHNQIIANCKSALTATNGKVSPKVTFKLPDMDKMEEGIKALVAENGKVLNDPVGNKGAITTLVIPNKSYTLKEALEQYQKSIKFLKAYFKDEDEVDEKTGKPQKVVQMIKKYAATEEKSKAKCEKTKDINNVKKAMSGLLMAETTLVMAHIQFIKGVSQCSKTIAKETSRMTAKEAAFEEAVKEYTMLSCIKALRLEEFPVRTVKEIAYNYAHV